MPFKAVSRLYLFFEFSSNKDFFNRMGLTYPVFLRPALFGGD